MALLAGRYRGEPWPWDASVEVYDRPGEFMLGAIEILGVEGKHADPWGKEFGQLNTIFRIEVDGLSIVHLGDNGPLTAQNVSDLRPVDILMLPADGLEHILKNREIAAIVAALEPRAVIPMHYRIPELESEPDSPDDLGDIDSWLAGRENVVRLGGSRWEPKLQRASPEIVVFQPSPLVARAPTGD
jgi:L-ascorbate metabolism protein UlaG (beta-lactamase superfamily)